MSFGWWYVESFDLKIILKVGVLRHFEDRIVEACRFEVRKLMRAFEAHRRKNVVFKKSYHFIAVVNVVRKEECGRKNPQMCWGKKEEKEKEKEKRKYINHKTR